MRKEILAAIQPLWPAYRKSFTSDKDRKMTMDVYVLGLGEIPPVYIASAVVKFLRGEVKRWNPADVPSVEELAREANTFWQYDLDRQRRAQENQAALEHQPPAPLPPEEQARRRAFVERSIKRMPPVTMPGGRIPLTELPQDQAQADLDVIKANRNRSIPVSNELFDILTGKG